MLQSVGPLPEWLVVGLALGVVLSAGVAVLFWAVDRRFPSPTPVGGTNAERHRREELRAYLRAIGEPFAEDHPVAGQPVAFYLPERDVAITFDARAYFRIQHTDTHPVLVEHEMPAVLLGARLPFDTPDVGADRTGTDPSGEGRSRANPYGDAGDAVAERRPVLEAYRELGLSAAATVEEVKAAYRRRVKEVHPDHGGDEAAFRRVREAYTTAKEDASGRA